MNIKTLTIGFAVFGIVLTAFSDEFRIFMDSAGREVEACLIDFIPKTESVKLKMRNNKTNKVNLSVFCEKDQEYIRNWKKATSLLSGMKLKLSTNKKRLDSGYSEEKEKGWTPSFRRMKYDDIAYEITLRNNTDQTITNLQIKYCIYIESQIAIDGATYDGRNNLINELKVKHESENRFQAGSWDIPKFGHNDQLIKLTKKIRLRSGDESKRSENYGTGESWVGHHRNVDDRLLGIRIRLSIPLSNEEPCIKEYALPADLITATLWMDYPPPEYSEPPGYTTNTERREMRKLAHNYRRGEKVEKDCEKAVEIFKQLYTTGGRAYDAYEVGNIYLWEHPEKSYEKARQWLDYAIFQQFARAHICLAKYYDHGYDQDAWDIDKAVYHGQLAVQLEPEDVSMRVVLARLYFKNGQVIPAVETQKKAVELVENNSEYREGYISSIREKLKFYQPQLN